MKIKGNLLQLCLLGAVLLQALSSDAQPVTKVTASKGHSLFLKSDGSLWGMGGNTFGELGSGGYSTTNLPSQIMASNVTAVAAGRAHNLFLKSNGSLWAMGWNQYGQLGDGTFIDRNYPKQIVASNVTAIAAGYAHSLFLKNDGSLWAVGRNDDGQLGDGSYIHDPNFGTNRAEQIVASNVTAIAAGWKHSLFLKNDGSLWAMGENHLGQLGDGTYGTSPYFGTNRPKQVVASNVTAIAAGAYHSLFLKSDGSLWGMGNNIAGQLGDGTYGDANFGTNRAEQIVASNVTAIAAGFYHSLFLKNDGSLWAMGYSEYGQLGWGTWNDTNRPEQVVARNVTAIAAGNEHSLFLKSDGSLWAMGDNLDGDLGDGTGAPVNLPKQILGAYNLISFQPLIGGNMQFSFVGIAGTNYALDRSFSLAPPNWFPQVTNPANSFGALVFTNTPSPATNNFWRIRCVP
jgi:alpha-tubulin suppressor-like RCC1 family protein